ncbi:MAG TPA: cation:proton antiporter [Candidatus Saccharimonadales bacterium]|jgi:Kef-type K+ transport system membrane component KefB|nr:cation:proton antiporter [Candidatus Saccharimonadales bacterium]
MTENVFTALSIIIVIASLMALVMRLIRQPLIIGYILTGIIVGPFAFHILKSASTITTFSNIGIALLLFIIGLGLNPKVIKEVGKLAGLVGVVEVFLVSIAGWGVGRLVGLDFRQSIFLGVALSFSSTIIILKLLSDKKEQNRLYGKITIGILIVQDLLAAIALLFVTSQGHNQQVSISNLGWLAFKGIGITVLLLLIGTKIIPRFHKFISSNSEFLFLFAIGWGFGIAALFQGIGFSLEIGALLAGFSLAGLPFVQEISSRLKPLRDFFIIVFFISLGSRLSLSGFGSNLKLLILSILIVVVLKPIIVMLTISFAGYTKQTSFKTAASLGQVSEFSLVLILLGNASGIVPENVVNVITISALVTITLSTYAINYSSFFYKILKRQLSILERGVVKNDRIMIEHQYDLILFGYKKGGQEFIRLFQELEKKFVVVDYDPEVIEQMDHQHLNSIFGDATDVELLDEIGIEKAKLVVSMITDNAINVFLVKLINKLNPKSIVIVHAENVEQATELYDLGASYVVMPHYIGSENIGAFIKNSALKKSEFIKYQQKHVDYIKNHYSLSAES